MHGSSHRLAGKLQVLYRNLTRKSSTSFINGQDLEFFSALLSDRHVISKDIAIIQDAGSDWTGKYQSQAQVVLRPSTHEQVSELLKYCTKRKMPVVTQGGKTGLVAAGVPVEGNEVVLQMARMNKIETGDEYGTGIVKCQAGCVLQDMQEHCADERNLLFPVDLGAKGTCQIGGNLASNAGGQFYYRYGSLAANVVGLRVVLMDGSVLDLNFTKCNLKDNTGYKLHQLMIGSEGTLGVITDVAIACPVLPKSRMAAMLACSSFNEVLATVRHAKETLGETVAALEWMDNVAWSTVQQNKNLKVPNITAEAFDFNGPHFLLVETHGSCSQHDNEKMSKFLDTAFSSKLVSDGVIAADENQRLTFWNVRESCNPMVASLGYTYKYDLSLPVPRINEWIQEMQREVLDSIQLETLNANWGHVLDGNLHFNVVSPACGVRQSDVLGALEPTVYDLTLRYGGSVSAEHGIGASKRHLLNVVHDEATLRMMSQLKQVFDPNSLLNPGKMLPS